MSEPFLAEIRIVGFNFAPRGWAFCDGQILPINQNQSLFSLLGTTYGGDGRTTFALPELRGRAPIHTGSSAGGTNHALGQKSGQENHTLSASEVTHGHNLNIVDAEGTNTAGAQSSLSVSKFEPRFSNVPNGSKTMNSGSVSSAGNGDAHENMQPYLALNFCIALQGLFPSRN
ncbi:Microcystin-dependent protein [Mariniphaga anaerophila]|uniref:Microcystin-dependent protein n=1 Tax=Mariniphaga anaerophila TaxID=1484053 RepID=A0A1M5ET31_9BACT|nr:tail fiber protein [Mariniphaga anaerophila]SHF82291.1 Microcystin-dependent protein [Mariniphaga anaerophila]